MMVGFYKTDNTEIHRHTPDQTYTRLTPIKNRRLENVLMAKNALKEVGALHDLVPII